jgi:hypothetical protein
MIKAKVSSGLLVAASVLALGGCTAETNPFKDMQMPGWLQANKTAPAQNNLISINPDCPRVAALPELARVTQFADETNPNPATILSETSLTKLDSSCITTETTINLDIVLNFTSILGTAGLAQAAPQASYSHAYFVAVVNPDGSILAKDVFALSPVFTSGQKEVYSSERLQQSIPLSSTIPAAQYQVMVGFQLNESELNYNRSLKPVQTMNVAPVAPAVPATSSSAASTQKLDLMPKVRNRKPIND